MAGLMVVDATKEMLRRTRFFDLVTAYRGSRAVRTWDAGGRPAPPPHAVKVRTVREYARRFGLTTLVETGTYLGDMVFATRADFRRVYTVELSDELHARAQRRFAAHPHVAVLHGDSGEVLPSILAELREPALFWLDGHYSGGVTARGVLDSPIEEELRRIAEHPVRTHVMLVDDARCFDGSNGYPALDRLEALVRELRPDWGVEVRDDIIRIHQ